MGAGWDMEGAWRLGFGCLWAAVPVELDISDQDNSGPPRQAHPHHPQPHPQTTLITGKVGGGASTLAGFRVLAPKSWSEPETPDFFLPISQMGH